MCLFKFFFVVENSTIPARVRYSFVRGSDWAVSSLRVWQRQFFKVGRMTSRDLLFLVVRLFGGWWLVVGCWLPVFGVVGSFCQSVVQSPGSVSQLLGPLVVRSSGGWP